MSNSDQGGASLAIVEKPDDFSQSITSLRLLGADRFDPIGLHYLEVLATRTKNQNNRVKRILEEKLKHALDGFGLRFQQAQRDANDAISLAASNYPHAAADLQQLLQAGDLKGVRQLTATLTRSGQRESLSSLNLYIEQHSTEYAGRPSQGNVVSRAELKSVRQFRNTWSKLSANKQVTQALVQAPKNAGPINSHMLVLRSLALMRDISPDYLNRFVSYVDTLLGLDLVDSQKQTNVKIAVGGATGKKTTGLRRGRP
jgi:hypothetical protein